MGGTVGKGRSILDALSSLSTPLHIVMIGLDSAGKTTALYRLKFDEYLNSVPTIGFNCENVKGTTGKSKGSRILQIFQVCWKVCMQYILVMIGLDSAGKTTALYRLKFDQYLNSVPTIGFNCENVKGTTGKSKGISFLVWDVGGQDKLRPLWRSYTRGTDGIVFVIDSADTERMDEAKHELIRTVKSQENSAPILVLANKQDLPGAKNADAIEAILGLADLGPEQLYKVQPTCAIKGEGLEEGLEALYNMTINRKRPLKNSTPRAAKRKRRESILHNIKECIK